MSDSILLLIAAVLAGLLVGALVLAWLARRREAGVLADRLAAREAELAAGAVALQEAQRQAAGYRSEAAQLRRQLDEALASHALDHERLLKMSTEHAALSAASREQAVAAADKLRLLEQAEVRLRESFQNLANQILEAKVEHLRESSAAQLGSLLGPFNKQLTEFREAVTRTHADQQRERGELVGEIRTLRELNQRIGQDAENLTRALKGDTRTQGAWGEMVLERVLEASGLQAGREFETQASFTGAEGERQRPDVIVHLPEGKDIIIDAKVSLVAWERAVAAPGDAERVPELREHVQSIKRHVDGLAARNYNDIPGLRTLDFVLMFVPVEAAMIEALKLDPNLYSYALERRISLVSPGTLLATLRTVAYLWRNETRNANALDIARRAARLHDNFVTVLNELVALGTQLDRAQQAHQSVVKRLTEGGKGSVILQVRNLAELGAPATKSMPAALVEAAGAESAVDADSSADTAPDANEALRDGT